MQTSRKYLLASIWRRILIEHNLAQTICTKQKLYLKKNPFPFRHPLHSLCSHFTEKKRMSKAKKEPSNPPFTPGYTALGVKGATFLAVLVSIFCFRCTIVSVYFACFVPIGRISKNAQPFPQPGCMGRRKEKKMANLCCPMETPDAVRCMLSIMEAYEGYRVIGGRGSIGPCRKGLGTVDRGEHTLAEQPYSLLYCFFYVSVPF